MLDSSKPSHSAGPDPNAPIAAGRQVSKLSLSPSVTSNSYPSPQGSASRISLANPAFLMGASIIHLQSATKPSAKASSEFANSPSLTQPRSTCHAWRLDSPVETGKQSPKSSTTSSPIMDSKSPFTT